MLLSLAVSLVASPLACGDLLVVGEDDDDGRTIESGDASTGTSADGSSATGRRDQDDPSREPDADAAEEGQDPPSPEQCVDKTDKIECLCEAQVCYFDCSAKAKDCVVHCRNGSTCRVICGSGTQVRCDGEGTTCITSGQGCSCSANNRGHCTPDAGA